MIQQRIERAERWRKRTLLHLACGHKRSVGGFPSMVDGRSHWHCLDCDVYNGDGFTPPGVTRG